MDAPLAWTLIGLCLFLSIFAVSLAIVALDVVRELQDLKRGPRGRTGPAGPACHASAYSDDVFASLEILER